MASQRLTRSTDERVIAGVCGGVAAHLGIDPTLVRVLWALAVVIGGFGLLAYVILWLVVPEEGNAPGQYKAVEIAEQRYARGEISAEDLRQIREDLASR